MEFCAIAEYSPLRAHAARNRHVGCGLGADMRRCGGPITRAAPPYRRDRPKAAFRWVAGRRIAASSKPSFIQTAEFWAAGRQGCGTLRTCSLAANARAESPNRSSHLQHREFGSIADFPIPVIQEQCETSATSAIAARAASSLSLIRSLIKARECCAERGGRSEI